MEARERLLTPGEVASLFRVDPKTVTRWAASGLLRSVKTPGGHRRFWASDVYRLLDSQDEDAVLFLLWSNKHGAWWGAGNYTRDETRAQRYTEHEAVQHVVKVATETTDRTKALVMVVAPL